MRQGHATTWRDMVQAPTSKLDDDAFTRARIILMNGLEIEANRFSHACARMNRDLQLPLARVRRVEQHQATLVNWLLPADLSPLETTLAYEQVAIEVTASVALREPDPYMAQVYRFGLLEDFDHLYRFSALYMGCSQQETNPRIKAIWDRFLDYELGQLHFVMELFKQVENRDPAELLPAELPEPIEYKSHREFIRETLAAEVDLRASGTQFVGKEDEPERSLAYREQLNSEGSPTETVAAGYRWRPGTELTAGESALKKGA